MKKKFRGEASWKDKKDQKWSVILVVEAHSVPIKVKDVWSSYNPTTKEWEPVQVLSKELYLDGAKVGMTWTQID